MHACIDARTHTHTHARGKWLAHIQLAGKGLSNPALSLSPRTFRPANLHGVALSSAIHAPLMVKVLLWNYINQEKCPPELYRGSEEAGLLSSVTSAMACECTFFMTQLPAGLWLYWPLSLMCACVPLVTWCWLVGQSVTATAGPFFSSLLPMCLFSASFPGPCFKPASFPCPWVFSQPYSHVLVSFQPHSHVLIFFQPRSHVLIFFQPYSHVLIFFQPHSQFPVFFQPHSQFPVFFQPYSQFPVFLQPHFHVLAYFQPHFYVTVFSQPHSCIVNVFIQCHSHVPIFRPIPVSALYWSTSFPHVPIFRPIPVSALYWSTSFRHCSHFQAHSCVSPVLVHLVPALSPFSGPFLCQPCIGPPHSRIVPIFSQPDSHDVPALHLFPCCVYFQWTCGQ